MENISNIKVEAALQRHKQFVNSGMARLMSMMGIQLEQEGAYTLSL